MSHLPLTGLNWGLTGPKGFQKASKREAFGGPFGDIFRKPEKCDFEDPSHGLGRSRGPILGRFGGKCDPNIVCNAKLNAYVTPILGRFGRKFEALHGVTLVSHLCHTHVTLM